MAQARKHPESWILTSSEDFTRHGVLQLGQVLTDPWNPDTAILTTGVEPVPDGVLRDRLVHNGVSLTSHVAHSLALRAWLQVNAAQGVNIGGGAGTGATDEAHANYHGKSISVDMFQPNNAYARRALGRAKAEKPETLQVSPLKPNPRLFLVTGLRLLGAGTVVDIGNKENVEGRGHMETNTPAELGTAGVGAEATRVTEHAHTIETSSEFVYAYRLHQIIVKRVLSQSLVAAFTRGETHSMDRTRSSDNVPTIKDSTPVDMEFVGILEDAFGGDGNKEAPRVVT